MESLATIHRINTMIARFVCRGKQADGAAAVPAIVESRDDSAEVAEAKAFMDAFRKRATETSELHKSDPGAGAGKSRLLIEISSSRPKDMVVAETPRAALTSLSFILRN